MAMRGRGLHAYLVEHGWVIDSAGSAGGRAMSYIALTSVVFAPLAIYFFVLGPAVDWGELRCASAMGGFWSKNVSEAQIDSSHKRNCVEDGMISTVDSDGLASEGDEPRIRGWLLVYFSYPSTKLGLAIMVPALILFFGLLIGWLTWRKRASSV